MAETRRNHDSAYKYLFKNRRIFLQLLQSFVQEDFVQNLQEEDIELVDKSFVSEELLDRESDLLYCIKKGDRLQYVYILLEFQSSVDKSIPLRMGLYILMLYDQLYRQSRRGPLPNVFPLLLYSGRKKWTIPLNLRDLVATNIPERYIPNFEYYPILIKKIPYDTIERLDNLVAAVAYMEKQSDEEGIRQALEKVFDFIRHEYILEVRTFMVWLTRMFRADIPLEVIERIRDVKEAKPMLTELAERIERKAEKKGKLEGKLETARTMHADGVSIEQIIKYTGLSREVVERNLGK